MAARVKESAGTPLGALSRWPSTNSEIGRAVADLRQRPDQVSNANPGLVFAKFMGPIVNKAYENARPDKHGDKPPIQTMKGPSLGILAKLFDRWARDEAALVSLLVQRGRSAAEALADLPGGDLIHITANLRWRMTSRLGEAHPFESGFMFHPLLGVPYVPGSGFKGAVRFAYWARYVAEEKDDAPARSKKFMQLIFGSDDVALGETPPKPGGESHERGAAVFFDVLPPADARLEVDILNPHFPGWYRGERSEADNDNPLPSPFLTVASSSPWSFLVAWVARAGLAADEKKEAIERLRQSLNDCLMLWGLGAKTSAGYGRFEGVRTDSASAAGSPVADVPTTVTTTRAPTAGQPPRIVVDALRTQIDNFKPRDMGQLPQLLTKIQALPDANTRLSNFAAHLKKICGKAQLKQLVMKHPVLGDFLK